jgi:predicted Zn finger-like uncharacterized protein
MSLTTHCPRCATAFLVTQAQLGEAQGWVRCGMCQEVFIAQAHTAAPPQTQTIEAPLVLRQEVSQDEEPRLDEEALPASIASPNPGEASPPQTLQSAPTRPAPAPASPSTPTGSGRFLIAALSVLLLFQAVLSARDSVVEAFPTSVSWLQSLCPKGPCGLRQINALAIEDSSFTTSDPKLFHLSATVVNRSNLVVKAPVLALTLTDATDQAIARKVYTPQDWGATALTLPGATRTQATLWIQWDDASKQQPVAGYRLQAFFPE